MNLITGYEVSIEGIDGLILVPYSMLLFLREHVLGYFAVQWQSDKPLAPKSHEHPHTKILEVVRL